MTAICGTPRFCWSDERLLSAQPGPSDPSWRRAGVHPLRTLNIDTSFLKLGRGSSAPLRLGESWASLANGSPRAAPRCLDALDQDGVGAPASTAPEMSCASTPIMTSPDPGGAAHLAHALSQGVHAARAGMHAGEPAAIGVERRLAAGGGVAHGDDGSGFAVRPQIIEVVDWQIQEGVVDYRAAG
jgi:hypothetical protein